MKHRASRRFWKGYDALPADVQRLADAGYALMKSDMRHPSLHLKRVGRFWSARVGSHYRALAVEAGDDLLWFWIGHHAEYDRRTLAHNQPLQWTGPDIAVPVIRMSGRRPPGH